MIDKPLVESIVGVVASEYAVDADQVTSRCRTAPVVEARWTLQWILFYHYNKTIRMIAEYFEMDQSSVNNAINKSIRRYRRDSEYRDSIEQMVKMLQRERV